MNRNDQFRAEVSAVMAEFRSGRVFSAPFTPAQERAFSRLERAFPFLRFRNSGSRATVSRDSCAVC